MKKKIELSIIYAIVYVIFLFSLTAESRDTWVCGYYPGWSLDDMPPNAINYDAVTHIIQFSFEPKSDGSLANNFNLTPSNCNSAVEAAHNASRKILICIGGASTATGFRGATDSQNRSVFIENIMDKVTTHQYDGVDIDWEPVASSDEVQYKSLIQELRTALDSYSSGLLLTTACGSDYFDPTAYIFADLQDKFDQINIMTYCMSGPWEGWVTWHNGAVYDGGLTFPNSSRFVPSADGYVKEFLEAGVSADKIGIGIAFHGTVWSGGSGTSTGGVTAPRQDWSSAPSTTSDVPYKKIIDNYYESDRYHYDTIAEAPYLSIDNSGASSDTFISYEDENSISAKFDYIIQNNLGGCIIWELSQDFFEANNSPLKQAVKEEIENLSVDIKNKTAMQKIDNRLTNYPNPFKSNVTITYYLPYSTNAKLEVYNSGGKLIRIFTDETKQAGNHSVYWNIKKLPSGVYIYKLTTGNFVVSRLKCLKIK